MKEGCSTVAILALGVMLPAVVAMAVADASAQTINIGMAMVGGSIPDGGDDVGPANEVQSMIERDHPVVTVSGMVSTSWAQAQPMDPGDGPNVYDWSSLDAKADELIPGKALLAYYQMWGTSPAWADWENDRDRFWQKFEEFLEAMVIYINQNYGTVYYTFENEPNISRAPDGWNWADWYMHCLPHFYTAVHAANAVTGMENKVIAGNLCGHSAGGFNDLYARGLKDYSDILGYHPYPYDIRDGVEVADLAQIHAIQVSYGDGDKKIWVSEGWGSGRSAGFDRSSPLIEPPAQEVENMWLAMTKGWDNVMTPQENWHPDYLWGMKFFCGNDNWGAMNWRKRAIPQKDGNGNIIGFIVDGYWMTPDIAPYFWNGGMMDFYGNSKDCLIHVFPGDGLVFMNPGFELASEPPDAHLPHFWTPEVDPAPSENYGLDDMIFRGGSRSLKLTQTAADNNGVYQVTVKRSATGSESYRARVWCKTEDVSGLTAEFYMRFRDIDGAPKGPKRWATDVTGNSDWQQMEVIATAPGGTSRIEVGCYVNGIGTAWFDDVTISMTSQAETGTVRGYTLDEGQIPVPSCIVRATTNGFQVVSDENGYYDMQNVPTGTYDFVCRKPGYVPHRVKNQTVAAGKLTFVSFNMGIPKPGLTVTQVTCDKDVVALDEPVNVTVTVANSKPYPNMISEVNVFVELDGQDASDRFSIRTAESNPKVMPASDEAAFAFTLTPQSGPEGQSFEVNAYAFGQEDRPNMVENGGFDTEPWDYHWSFTGGARTLTWEPDETDYYSPPRSLKCYVYDYDYTWNWANNWSAYGPNATEAYPARNYTVGVYHKDNITGGVSVDLFIQEYYYDGNDWYYNGRRFAAVPHRSVWAHDVIMYETGDPNVTQGLYSTNRLVVSCGPCTSPTVGSGDNWWDDLYLKETGDWLADDRGDTGASLTVGSVALRPEPGTLVFQDGRRYPDETSYSGTADSHLVQHHELYNTGGCDVLEACRQFGGDPTDDRSIVIKFTDLDTSWEAGRVLQQAVLTLDYFGSRDDPGGVQKTLYVHKLLHDWGEGNKTGIDGAWADVGEVCWTKPFGTEDNGNPNWAGTLDDQYADPAALDSATLSSGAYGAVSFDVTEAVREHLGNPGQNFGFVIREELGSENPQDGTRQFRSRKVGSISARPSLTLTFVDQPPPVSIESVQTMADHGAPGELGLNVDLTASTLPADSALVTTESREAGITKLVIDCDGDVTLPNPPESLVESIGGVNNGDVTPKVVSVTAVADVITINLNTLPDQDTYTVMLADSVIAGDNDFMVRALQGEVNSDGTLSQVVNAMDLSEIRMHFGAEVAAGNNAVYDIVSDGVINALDLSACRTKFAHTAP